jgi:hypothetical protein
MPSALARLSTEQTNAAQPKVCELQVTVLVDEQIIRLQVTENDC